VELDAVVGWNAHQVPCLRATGGGVLDLLISVRVDWRWLEGWKLRLWKTFTGKSRAKIKCSTNQLFLDLIFTCSFLLPSQVSIGLSGSRQLRAPSLIAFVQPGQKLAQTLTTI
jgi:hypothetical protein